MTDMPRYTAHVEMYGSNRTRPEGRLHASVVQWDGDTVEGRTEIINNVHFNLPSVIESMTPEEFFAVCLGALNVIVANNADVALYQRSLKAAITEVPFQGGRL